jgi:hypothetical protein
MEGDKSIAAPVCSFHGHVSAMAATAPAARQKVRVGQTNRGGSLAPGYAAEREAAEDTVVYSASPRARTQSGNATWADTLNIASATIHDAPAVALARSAVTGSWAIP